MPAIVVTALIIELVGIQRALWVYANQENLARAAIEIFPDGPDGWEWLGNVHIDRGDDLAGPAPDRLGVHALEQPGGDRQLVRARRRAI